MARQSSRRRSVTRRQRSVRRCPYVWVCVCGATDARSMQHPCTWPGRYRFLSNDRSFGLTPDVAIELQHTPAKSSAFQDHADRPCRTTGRMDTGYASVLTRCAAGFPASRASDIGSAGRNIPCYDNSAVSCFLRCDVPVNASLTRDARKGGFGRGCALRTAPISTIALHQRALNFGTRLRPSGRAYTTTSALQRQDARVDHRVHAIANACQHAVATQHEASALRNIRHRTRRGLRERPRPSHAARLQRLTVKRHFSLRQFTEPRFSMELDSISISKPLRSRYLSVTT